VATTYRETAPETPLPALSPPLVTGIANGRHNDGRWLLRLPRSKAVTGPWC
jgi:hypothetical protein